MKSVHGITKAALVCAAAALLTAAGCAAPSDAPDTIDTQSTSESIVAVRRTAVRVGGWGGAAVVRRGAVVGFPVATPYYTPGVYW